MTTEDNKGKEYILLPHHEQQELCTNRLAYRQGRKLTAIKVYSINNESKHLLVFGVPTLNLRQETKALFLKFGKLQFNTTKYPSEQFTETYHAIFENIQSARLAKKLLDTKNFYGGNLHICYAPELESIEETREKLMLRQKNVVARLKNLQNEVINTVVQHKKKDDIEKVSVTKEKDENRLYMGVENSIQLEKRKTTDYKSVKKFKAKKSKTVDKVTTNINDIYLDSKSATETEDSGTSNPSSSVSVKPSSSIEVIDFTSTEKEVLTNINESLNYNNFGNELIKTIPHKRVNKIKFNLNKNSLL